MKNILYIGNNLKSKKSNLSAIQILGPLLEKEGYKVNYASSKQNKILRLFDMIWKFLKLRFKIDYVLIDTYSTLNFYYALIISQICRIFKRPYITILHGGNLESRLINSKRLSHLIFKYAKYNISPSLYLKDIFEKHNFDNIKYIPNSIEITKYQFKERATDSINLLWVRSFSKIYNPSLAIQALKSLQSEGLEVNLCMVGPDSDGSLKDVKSLAKQLNVNVNFTGKLKKEEWISLSEDYNIFINTTNFDNMPVSVIEAMALGLKVVSTNVGGIPFLISNNKEGLLVEPNDVKSFANAIKQIANNTDVNRAMTINARQKVEHFDWESVKPFWLGVLN